MKMRELCVHHNLTQLSPKINTPTKALFRLVQHLHIRLEYFSVLCHQIQFHLGHYITNSKHRIYKQVHYIMVLMSNSVIPHCKLLIRPRHSPYRLSWIPLACTSYYSIAKKVLQLIHNMDCRIVECQFILVSVFGARPKSCTNLLCFVQRQAIYFCVCHSKVASHHDIWHDLIIPRKGKGRTMM